MNIGFHYEICDKVTIWQKKCTSDFYVIYFELLEVSGLKFGISFPAILLKLKRETNQIGGRIEF